MKSIHLDQPHVLLMVGAQGSGKSTFAREFAQMFGAPLVDLEQFYTQITDAKVTDAIAMYMTAEFLKTKQTILVDLDESTNKQRASLAALARKHGYKFRIIWVQTDAPTIAYRLSRKHKLPEHDPRIQQSTASFQPPRTSEKPIVISGRHTFATQARGVLKKLVEARKTTPASPVVPDRAPAARASRIDIR